MSQITRIVTLDPKKCSEIELVEFIKTKEIDSKEHKRLMNLLYKRFPFIDVENCSHALLISLMMRKHASNAKREYNRLLKVYERRFPYKLVIDANSYPGDQLLRMIDLALLNGDMIDAAKLRVAVVAKFGDNTSKWDEYRCLEMFV